MIVSCTSLPSHASSSCVGIGALVCVCSESGESPILKSKWLQRWCQVLVPHEVLDLFILSEFLQGGSQTDGVVVLFAESLVIHYVK